MPKANEAKKGAAVAYGGKRLIIKDITVNNPTARGASTLYKMRFSDIDSGQKVEETLKGDTVLDALDLERSAVNFSYQEGEQTIFMDAEDFSQYTFNNDDIRDELLYINEETQGLLVLKIDGSPVALELPQSVDLSIQETAPAIKGASATARSKPAHFSTGLVIQVPEYISEGEKVKIHTAEKRFMGRAD